MLSVSHRQLIVRLTAAPVVAAFFAAALCLVPGAAQADAVRVSGTRVTLNPPKDFAQAERFPGFRHREVAASILVSELPAPFESLRKTMTPEGIEAQGMKLLVGEEHDVDGRKALLVKAVQRKGGVETEKWMVLFGRATSSVLIVATYPRSESAKLSEQLRESLLTASWRPDAAIDPFDGLGFRLDEHGSMKVANRLSRMVLMVAQGGSGEPQPDDPLLVAGTGETGGDVGDMLEFAKLRLGLTSHLAEIDRIRGRPAKVDGMNGFEIQAYAVNAKTDTPVQVYQLVLVDRDTYYMVQGFVGPGRAGEYLPQFQKVANSLRRQR